MKLKNIFMCMAALSILFSCSDNEPYLDKPEDLEPTTLSICIDADGTIISKSGTDETIKNMYVFILKNDANGSVLKFDLTKTGTNEEGDYVGDEGAENKGIPVDAGLHQVLVIANVKDADVTALEAASTLGAIRQITTKLSEEVDGNLTMSSEVMLVNFQSNVRNKIGYADIENGEVDAYDKLEGNPVKLYRSVARIQLAQLGLAENSADNEVYGKPVSFTLKEIFVANAKGWSHLISDINDNTDANYLSIEATAAPENEKLWWFGEANNDKWTAGDILRKADLANSYFDKGSLQEDVTISVDEDEIPLVLAAKSVYPANPGIIGKSFYTYENAGATSGYQTLLILKGDYVYTKNAPISGDGAVDGEENTYIATDRYYAVAINPKGVEATAGNKVLRDHVGVLRNTAYHLIVTLSGRGSDYPYLPDANLYFNAKVEVADWSGVNIGGEIN